jgi:hypothetical protein
MQKYHGYPSLKLSGSWLVVVFIRALFGRAFRGASALVTVYRCSSTAARSQRSFKTWLLRLRRSQFIFFALISERLLATVPYSVTTSREEERSRREPGQRGPQRRGAIKFPGATSMLGWVLTFEELRCVCWRVLKCSWFLLAKYASSGSTTFT